MTEVEIRFRNLVEQYTLREFGYSVSDLRQDWSKTYTLKLKRPGDLEEKSFPVFPDQVQNAVLKGQLPQGLLHSIADCFTSQTA